MIHYLLRIEVLLRLIEDRDVNETVMSVVHHLGNGGEWPP